MRAKASCSVRIRNRKSCALRLCVSRSHAEAACRAGRLRANRSAHGTCGSRTISPAHHSSSGSDLSIYAKSAVPGTPLWSRDPPRVVLGCCHCENTSGSDREFVGHVENAWSRPRGLLGLIALRSHRVARSRSNGEATKVCRLLGRLRSADLRSRRSLAPGRRALACAYSHTCVAQTRAAGQGGIGNHPDGRTGS